MADDWIKMRTDLYRDPKVCLMADELLSPDGELAHFVNQQMQRDMTVTRNVTRNAVTGALVTVWGILRHRGKRFGDDLICSRVTPSVIDDMADLPGFGKAMASVGWVVETDAGLVFPRFFSNYNVDPAEKKAACAAERQRRHRAKAEGEKQRDAQRDTQRDAQRDTAVTRSVTVTHREEQSRAEQRREEKSTVQSQIQKNNNSMCVRAHSFTDSTRQKENFSTPEKVGDAIGSAAVNECARTDTPTHGFYSEDEKKNIDELEASGLIDRQELEAAITWAVASGKKNPVRYVAACVTKRAPGTWPWRRPAEAVGGPAPGLSGIKFHMETCKFTGLNGNLKLLEEKFPTIDVPAALLTMEAWLASHPQNVTNAGAFIYSWLARIAKEQHDKNKNAEPPDDNGGYPRGKIAYNCQEAEDEANRKAAERAANGIQEDL